MILEGVGVWKSACCLRAGEVLLINSWLQHAFPLEHFIPFNEEMNTERNGTVAAVLQRSWIFSLAFLPSITLRVNATAGVSTQELLALHPK